MIAARTSKRRRDAWWSALGLTAVAGSAVLASQSHAEALVPPQSKWAVRVHLAEAHASPLGAMLMDAVRAKNPQADTMIDGLTESLGIDLRKDVGQVVLFGQGFEEMDLHIVADLGTSQGKLEGWALSFPGYDSEDLDEETLLHSFLVEDEHGGPPHGPHKADDVEMTRPFGDGPSKPMHRVFAALPKSTDGRYILVMAFDKPSVIRLAEQARGQDRQLTDHPLPKGTIAQVVMSDLSGLPINPNDPGSAVVKSVKAALLSVASTDRFTANMELTTTSPARARQLQSLLSGLLALPQIAAAQEPEAQIVADFAARVVVTPGEGVPTVNAMFTCEHNELRDMIEQFAAMQEAMHGGDDNVSEAEKFKDF